MNDFLSPEQLKERDTVQYIKKIIRIVVNETILKILDDCPKIHTEMSAEPILLGNYFHNGGITNGKQIIETLTLKFKTHENSNEFEVVSVVGEKTETEDPVVRVESSKHEPVSVSILWDLENDAANVIDVVKLQIKEILQK
jgi:hypothetical protein